MITIFFCSFSFATLNAQEKKEKTFRNVYRYFETGTGIYDVFYEDEKPVTFPNAQAGWYFGLFLRLAPSEKKTSFNTGIRFQLNGGTSYSSTTRLKDQFRFNSVVIPIEFLYYIFKRKETELYTITGLTVNASKDQSKLSFQRGQIFNPTFYPRLGLGISCKSFNSNLWGLELRYFRSLKIAISRFSNSSLFFRHHGLEFGVWIRPTFMSKKS